MYENITREEIDRLISEKKFDLFDYVTEAINLTIEDLEYLTYHFGTKPEEILECLFYRPQLTVELLEHFSLGIDLERLNWNAIGLYCINQEVFDKYINYLDWFDILERQDLKLTEEFIKKLISIEKETLEDFEFSTLIEKIIESQFLSEGFMDLYWDYFKEHGEILSRKQKITPELILKYKKDINFWDCISKSCLPEVIFDPRLKNYLYEDLIKRDNNNYKLYLPGKDWFLGYLILEDECLPNLAFPNIVFSLKEIKEYYSGSSYSSSNVIKARIYWKDMISPYICSKYEVLYKIDMNSPGKVNLFKYPINPLKPNI